MLGTSLGGGGLVPALALDFTTGTLDGRITFTRASSGTRVNSSGLIESVATNGPRFDHDPVTLATLGLLIEEQRTNLFPDSATFSAAAGTGTVATADATTSPTGATDATKMAANDAGGTGEVRFTGVNVTVATSTAHTFSVYAKKDTADFVHLGTVGFSSPGNVWTFFNLATGAVASVGGGHTATITPAGDGWYRCAITFTTHSSDTTGETRIGMATTDGGRTSTPLNGTNAIFVWGAQFEAGGFASSHIPTAGSTVTRSSSLAKFTPPAGIDTLTYTFDDASTQVVSCSPLVEYTIPTNLNRRRIKTIEGSAA